MEHSPQVTKPLSHPWHSQIRLTRPSIRSRPWIPPPVPSSIIPLDPLLSGHTLPATLDPHTSRLPCRACTACHPWICLTDQGKDTPTPHAPLDLDPSPPQRCTRIASLWQVMDRAVWGTRPQIEPGLHQLQGQGHCSAVPAGTQRRGSTVLAGAQKFCGTFPAAEE